MKILKESVRKSTVAQVKKDLAALADEKRAANMPSSIYRQKPENKRFPAFSLPLRGGSCIQ